MKNTVVIIIAGLALWVGACSAPSTENETNTEKEESVMYEASELALLMHEMENYHEAWKIHLENDTAALPSLKTFEALHTAQATNPDELNDTYYAFAKAYNTAIKGLNTSTQPDLQKKFYKMATTTCISCHENFCFGPISRIEKLFLVSD